MEVQFSYIVYFVLFIIVFVFLTIVLLFVEARLRKKYFAPKKSRSLFYKEKLLQIAISQETPEKNLGQLDSLARDFFSEAFKINKHREYPSLIQEFRQKGDQEAAEFSEIMKNFYYRGEEINTKDILYIVHLFEKMVDSSIMDKA